VADRFFFQDLLDEERSQAERFQSLLVGEFCRGKRPQHAIPLVSTNSPGHRPRYSLRCCSKNAAS